MISEIRGRARVLPDRVNTDYIVSSSRKKLSINPYELRQWLLEGIDPDFASSVKPGDILVAGNAFGCGSAMEVAVTTVRAAGIRAVVARSFARTYYRNAINNGLAPVECDTSGIREGDDIVIRLERDMVTVENTTRNSRAVAMKIPPFIADILEEGGLVEYLKTRGRFLV